MGEKETKDVWSPLESILVKDKGTLSPEKGKIFSRTRRNKES